MLNPIDLKRVWMVLMVTRGPLRACHRPQTARLTGDQVRKIVL